MLENNKKDRKRKKSESRLGSCGNDEFLRIPAALTQCKRRAWAQQWLRILSFPYPTITLAYFVIPVKSSHFRQKQTAAGWRMLHWTECRVSSHRASYAGYCPNLTSATLSGKNSLFTRIDCIWSDSSSFSEPRDILSGLEKNAQRWINQFFNFRVTWVNYTS